MTEDKRLQIARTIQYNSSDLKHLGCGENDLAFLVFFDFQDNAILSILGAMPDERFEAWCCYCQERVDMADIGGL